MKTAAIFFDQEPTKPWKTSQSMANGMMERAVEIAGYRIEERHYHSAIVAENVSLFLPFPHLVHHALPARRRIDAGDPVDLSVYCSGGLSSSPPDRRASKKNIVFFHVLANHCLWLGNESIDLFCANSPYFRDVLVSFLASPIWETQSILDRRAFSCVELMSLTLPCTEEPSDFVETRGERLSKEVAAILDGQDILGHAMQGGNKTDYKATCAIMLHANRVALERGLGRRVRLMVNAAELHYLREHLKRVPEDGEALYGALAKLRLSLDDIFVPVPFLQQRDLFKVFARCEFGLAYNGLPDSFGFYPLESVFHGCPVYTNGAGAMRSTLPPAHGINVFETEGMAFGADLSEYAAVAEAVVGDVVTSPRLAPQCRLGREYIATHYGRRNTYSDMSRCIARAESVPRKPSWEFRDLVLTLSPLVRIWNAATGGLVSDYAAMRLTAEDRAVLRDAIGRTAADATRLFTGEAFGKIRQYFERGILTFEVPESERTSASPG